MQLQYCSITGADDQTDIQELSKLSDQYPFSEWAILLLPAMAGKPRFPTIEWIKDFSKNCTAKNKAMHLCDQALLNFIAKDPETLELMSGFQRIQLNLKFGDMDGKYNPEELAARVKASPEWVFILQYSDDKKGLLPLFHDIPNHAVLFDESAGRGISPDSWQAPLNGHFCGYAGGMRPENIQQNIDMIKAVAPDDTTWIDMETGVRTNDQFDLQKVKTVLKIAAPYAIKT